MFFHCSVSMIKQFIMLDFSMLQKPMYDLSDTLV